jgi:LCP family protein required for cell wall assembly
MHNYRKNPRTTHHRTMDGVLSNAPGRQQHASDVWPTERRQLSSDRPRTPAGSIDDFKRAEGFHPSKRSQASLGEPIAETAQKHKVAHERAAQGSILHMTLPGGSLSGKKSKQKRAKKQGGWRTFRRWTLRSALVISALVILLGGYLFVKGYFSLHKVFKGGGNAAALQENVSPDLLKGEGDGRVNVLLLGRGGEGHDGADLTDTILLASIDPVNKTAALVSLPRDFWYTTSAGSATKINAVYANAKNKALRSNPNDKAAAEAAGVKAIREAVSKVLGVTIHYNVMVDFKAFQQAVDTVGGVTIDVPEALVDYTMAWQNGGNATLAKKGLNTFDGRKALMYVRSRHGSARGDFDRAERQRLFISALSQKVLSAGTYTNPVKISQLLDTFGNHVSTDFSVGDALRLMQISKGISGAAITSVGLADPPNVLVGTGMISGQSVVTPKAGTNDYSAIQSFVRTKLQDGYILKEKAKVMVLNGTSMSGLAATKGDELKTYGYNVTKVGDAPTKTYDKNIVIDLTGNKKPYTRNYLEKRFSTTAVGKLPDSTIQPEGADFVIILGSNETTHR